MCNAESAAGHRPLLLLHCAAPHTNLNKCAVAVGETAMNRTIGHKIQYTGFRSAVLRIVGLVSPAFELYLDNVQLIGNPQLQNDKSGNRREKLIVINQQHPQFTFTFTEASLSSARGGEVQTSSPSSGAARTNWSGIVQSFRISCRN